MNKLFLVVVCSAAFSSCQKSIANPPMIVGSLSLKLSDNLMTNCQSVVLDDPYIVNRDLKGRFRITVVDVSDGGKTVGYYPNPESVMVNLKRASQYEIQYVIQYPKNSEPLSLVFKCISKNTEITKNLVITEETNIQTIDLSF